MEDQESVLESKHDVVFVNTSEKRGDEGDKDKDYSAPWRVYAAHSLRLVNTWFWLVDKHNNWFWLVDKHNTWFWLVDC